jgi:protocatechuate 3,4-dioxygenase beta subunit
LTPSSTNGCGHASFRDTTTLRLCRAASILLLTLGGVSPSWARVDQEWLRMWEEAQKHRPATLTSAARIAPHGEPGTPLVIEGRVFGPDGSTPAPDVIVFAYHTDRDGIYSGPGKPGAPWRLQGWARTDSGGRFELRTIRPAPYPDRDVPAHVHVTLESPVLGRQWTPSLRFADDPLVSAGERARSAAASRFGHVCAVRSEDGVEHVEFLVKLKDTPDF